MSQEAVTKALNALSAIGEAKREPCQEPQAAPTHEEAFSASCFDFETRHTDPYWCKVMAAWRQIALHEYLPSAMRWAEKHYPDRYHRVTSEMPAAWERLWDEAAPLDDFQAALDRWVAAHTELISLFPVSRGTE